MSDANAAAQSLISSEVEIIGTIKSSGSLQIEGRVEGEILSEGDVLIGKSGSVKGNLKVNSVTLSGTVQGNIEAKDRIALKSTARLLGDIKAKRLSVEDGVTFVGKSEVNPTGQPIKFDEAPAAQEKPKQNEGQNPNQQGQGPRK
ncbi:polymer-forming cytoskeletal protein [Kiritimatiellota bacterium B12222]|nr:polymer-forming cytoskeletal protein [Kiritimatiellota bacterium B12222]